MNLRMLEKVREGDAIDISDRTTTPNGDYILDQVEDVDYCDLRKQAWIWSIGKHKQTGQILASTSAKFYQHPEYECLWLR